jgi:hypothetical protein
VAPSPGGALGTAGLSRKGRGGLGSCLRRNDTKGHTQRSLGSRLRGNETVAPSAGPAFGVASGQAGLARPCVSFPRKRESSCFFLDSCLRRKDTVPPHPAVPWAPPASPAVGRGVLDCCLRRNDTPGPARREVGQLLDGQGEAGCYIPLS